MNVTGIIAEYNPFHNGHLYHINQTRKTNADAIVVVLGSNVTQRGELPIFSKWARTSAALKNGADLVIELPAVYTAASAERFASAAVRILSGLGIVDTLSFGSECGDITSLIETAKLCDNIEKTPEFKAELAKGCSYPTARAQVISKVQADKFKVQADIQTDKSRAQSDMQADKSKAQSDMQADKSKAQSDMQVESILEILNSPNNTLGVEYIKAILQHNLQIKPMTIKREGVAHDGEVKNSFASASYIRKNILNELITENWQHSDNSFVSISYNRKNIANKFIADIKQNQKISVAPSQYGSIRIGQVLKYIPPTAREVFEKEILSGYCGQNTQFLERAFLYQLKTAAKNDFENIPDISEGLHNRMYNAAKSAINLEEYIQAVKTKRYTRSRICRHILHLMLHTPKILVAQPPSYIRILGHNAKGRELLSFARSKATLPIFSSFTKLSREFSEYAKIEENATTLFSLSLPLPSNNFNEYKTNIIREV